MFARSPELFVFDDLSSALDVETEQTMWTRLFKRRGRAGGKPASSCHIVDRPRDMPIRSSCCGTGGCMPWAG